MNGSCVSRRGWTTRGCLLWDYLDSRFLYGDPNPGELAGSQPGTTELFVMDTVETDTRALDDGAQGVRSTLGVPIGAGACWLRGIGGCSGTSVSWL